MNKRSLVLLSAFALALCASPLHAGQPSSKHTVKKSKTAAKKKKSKTTKSTSAMNTPTSTDQTTITPGTAGTTGSKSYDPNKGPRRPAPPKKKKP